MKKHQVAVLILLAIAAAITVGCGNSSPTFTNMPFMSNRTVDPATELFTMKLDGSNVTPVPVGDINVFSPTASANQKTLAFNSEGEVWGSIGSAAPVQLTQVTANDDADVDIVRVSPNGKKILYAVISDSSSVTYSLWIMNADGSGSTNLTATPPTGMGGCYNGSFSSDSSQIVFACYNNTLNEITAYAAFTMKADGSNVKQVISQAPFLDTPAFSPDNKQIFFATYGTPGSQSNAKHSLAASHFNLPNFHSKGTHSFNQRPHSYGSSTPTDEGVASVNVDGSNAQLIIPNSIFEVQVLNSNLYYTIFNNTEQIWKSNLDGTNPTLISDGTADDWFGFCYCE